MPDQMLFKPELMDAIPDAIVVVDRSSEIISANQAATELFDYPLQQLVGMSVEQLIPVDLRSGHEQTRKDFSAQPSRRLMGSGLHLKALRADGNTIDVEISLSPVEVEGAEIVVASVRDITERLTLEQRLIQTQRLESLGLLSAGIAHDFNNLLMPILGYANIATQQLPPESPALPRLHQIETAARAAADLFSNLTAYAGQADTETGPVDPTELIKRMAAILETTMSPRTVLSHQFADNLPAIDGDFS
ncbi:MAG TPA: PAS domain S-box protein [Dehalococcoidia bacterium]|nr:PAS domain S-box protein [Dehalococcoidia bacterium]